MSINNEPQIRKHAKEQLSYMMQCYRMGYFDNDFQWERNDDDIYNFVDLIFNELSKFYMKIVNEHNDLLYGSSVLEEYKYATSEKHITNQYLEDVILREWHFHNDDTAYRLFLQECEGKFLKSLTDEEQIYYSMNYAE